MRIMPFMKRKKGLQFAGLGLDTGGGGGGGSSIVFETKPFTTVNYTLGGNAQNIFQIDITNDTKEPISVIGLHCINTYDENYTQQVAVSGWFVNANTLNVICKNNFSSSNTFRVKADIIYK